MLELGLENLIWRVHSLGLCCASRLFDEVEPLAVFDNEVFVLVENVLYSAANDLVLIVFLNELVLFLNLLNFLFLLVKGIAKGNVVFHALIILVINNFELFLFIILSGIHLYLVAFPGLEIAVPVVVQVVFLDEGWTCRFDHLLIMIWCLFSSDFPDILRRLHIRLVLKRIEILAAPVASLLTGIVIHRLLVAFRIIVLVNLIDLNFVQVAHFESLIVELFYLHRLKVIPVIHFQSDSRLEVALVAILGIERFLSKINSRILVEAGLRLVEARLSLRLACFWTGKVIWEVFLLTNMRHNFLLWLLNLFHSNKQ